MLQREDFSPWYIRPFENYFKSGGIIPGIGPFGKNKENNPRAFNNPGIVDTILSTILDNVEYFTKDINKAKY